MTKYTAEQIQARFEQLPKEVKDAITSTDIHDELISIAKKNNLRIDQEGDLIDQVGLVMLGLSPSKEFVKNVSNELNVNAKIASDIAEDINEKIFAKIKKSMMQIQENENRLVTDSTISDLERVGGFTVEPQQGNDDRGTDHIESKARLIDGIENPPAVEIDNVSSSKTNTEPFIDHLLSAPVVTVEKKSEVTASKIPPKPVKSDPYKEPIE